MLDFLREESIGLPGHHFYLLLPEQLDLLLEQLVFFNLLAHRANLILNLRELAVKDIRGLADAAFDVADSLFKTHDRIHLDQALGLQDVSLLVVGVVVPTQNYRVRWDVDRYRLGLTNVASSRERINMGLTQSMVIDQSRVGTCMGVALFGGGAIELRHVGAVGLHGLRVGVSVPRPAHINSDILGHPPASLRLRLSVAKNAAPVGLLLNVDLLLRIGPFLGTELLPFSRHVLSAFPIACLLWFRLQILSEGIPTEVLYAVVAIAVSPNHVTFQLEPGSRLSALLPQCRVLVVCEDPLHLLVFVPIDAAKRVSPVRRHALVLEARRSAPALLADGGSIVVRPLVLHSASVIRKVHSIHFDFKFN